MGSGLGVDDDVLHVRLALSDVVLQSTRELVGLRERHIRRHADADEHDQAAVRVEQAQCARRLTGPFEDEL